MNSPTGSMFISQRKEKEEEDEEKKIMQWTYTSRGSWVVGAVGNQLKGTISDTQEKAAGFLIGEGEEMRSHRGQVTRRQVQSHHC